jgi:hypothetical protein
MPESVPADVKAVLATRIQNSVATWWESIWAYCEANYRRWIAACSSPRRTASSKTSAVATATMT